MPPHVPPPRRRFRYEDSNGHHHDRRDDDHDDQPPIRKRMGTFGIVLILIGSCVAFVAVGLVGLLVVVEIVRSSTAPPGASLPVVTADLNDVLVQWKKNPIATNEKYRGQRVELVGHVIRIGSNIRHQTFVHVSPDRNSRTYGDNTLKVWLLDRRVLTAMKDYPIGAKVRLRVMFNQETDSQPRATGVLVLPP